MNRSLETTLIPGCVPRTLVDNFKDMEGNKKSQTKIKMTRAKRKKKNTIYFLSHWHADHYGGLDEKWGRMKPKEEDEKGEGDDDDNGDDNDDASSHALIYTGPITARLVIDLLGVDPSFVRPLELNVSHQVGENYCVTLFDANHCPGAVCFLFEIDNGRSTYLHTGDFRFDGSNMKQLPLLQRFAALPEKRGVKDGGEEGQESRKEDGGEMKGRSTSRKKRKCHSNKKNNNDRSSSSSRSSSTRGKIRENLARGGVGKQLNAIFLDTTYCNPRHCLPSQREACDFAIQALRSEVREGQQKRRRES